MTFRMLCSAAFLAAFVLGAQAQDKGPDKGSDKAAGSGTSGASLYKVVDGTKVDEETFEGFRAWRAAACDRCHGANQEGLVGPSLIESLKTLPKEEFVKVVRDGRLEKGMQSFGNSKIVMENIDHLYAYLKGRSDGAITQAKVSKIDE
jgi:mono/diheme cytochrome c family protein